jgi:hypothetical protein
MSENGLYDFLNKLSKQREIKIGDLAIQCGLSRTTFYRYAKGLIQIPPNIEAAISQNLTMTKNEREQFRRLISSIVQDGSMISARYALDNLFFPDITHENNSEPISFALHYNDKYLRNSEEICEMFLEHSESEMFRCDIKVLNCVGEHFIDDLLPLLSKLLSSPSAVTVEHLLIFPQKDYLTCAKNLSAVMPLLGNHNYSVYYNDQFDSSAQSQFFANNLGAEVSWREDGQIMRRYFIMSYLPDGISQCVAFDNVHLSKFFQELYQNLRSKYRKSLVTIKNIMDLGDLFSSLEFAHEMLFIKGNPSYARIPLHVYESVLERMSDENKKALQLDSHVYTDNLRYSLKTRYSYAYKKGNIDVYSKCGLHTFTKTGILMDHLDGLPPFNENERKMVLEDLRNHIIKKSGGHRIYITEKAFDYVIGAFKNTSLFIGFPHSYKMDADYNNGYPFVFIENKVFADILFDYATHHIPAYHALPTEAAVQYLDDLIEML